MAKFARPVRSRRLSNGIKNNLALFLVIGLVLIVGFCFFKYFSARAQEQIKILPSTFSGDPSTSLGTSWQNPEAAFSQDLSENAGFEEFNEENSAYPSEILEIPIEETATSTVEEFIEEIPYQSFQDDTWQAATSTEEIVLEESELVQPETPVATSTEEIIPEEVIPEESEPTPTATSTAATSTEEEIIEEVEAEPIPAAATSTENFIPEESEESTQPETSATSTTETINIPEETATTTNTGTQAEINKPSFFASLWTKFKNLFKSEVRAESLEAELPQIERVLILSDFGVAEEFQDTEIKNVQLRMSLAGKGGTGDRLIVDYYYRDFYPEGSRSDSFGAWQNLAEFSLENEISNVLNGGYFLYGLPIFENWEDLENLKIRFTYQTFQVSGFKLQEVYLDAVWLEVEYEGKEEPVTGESVVEKEPIIKEPEAEVEESKEEYTLELISNKKDFKLAEEPSFKFRYQKKRGFFEAMGASIWNLFRDEYKDINIKVAVSGLNISPNIRYQKNGEFLVELEKPRQFKAGKYKLKIEIESQGQIFIQEQDFTWGVLAINVNKSIYLPNETAYLQMAALRDDGHTVCDTNLKLEITSPSGGLSSVTVERSGKCGPDNVTDVPDYFAYYQVGKAGIYEMRLTNLDNDYEITDSFEVRESIPFNIERIGPTRIYPPASYKMRMIVRVNEDFTGVVKESVPDSFEIIEANETRISTRNGAKEIVWEVDWKQGETYELKYTFDAPDVSPYLYLLGPLKIGDFQEARQWQIAADVENETGVVMYNDNTANLFWQSFNENGFNGENTISDPTGLEFWIDCEASPIDADRIICGANDQANGDILTYLYDAVEDTMTVTPTQVTDNTPALACAYFDIEFEHTTGDALIVYIESDDNDVKYRILTAAGSDWGDEQTWKADTDWDNGTWIRAARDPGSESIMVGLESTDNTLVTALWDGSSVGDTTVHDITSRAAGAKVTQEFDIAWEGDTGEAILIWGDDTATMDIRYDTFTSGGGWAGQASYGSGGTNSKGISIQLATEYGGSHGEVGFCYVTGNDKDVICDVWTGAGWDGPEDPGIEAEPGKGGRSNLGLAWSYESGNEDLIVLTSGKTSEVRHFAYDQDLSTWSADVAITADTNQKGTVEVRADPNSGAMAASNEDAKNLKGQFGFLCVSDCKTDTSWGGTSLKDDDTASANQVHSIVFLDGTVSLCELTQNNWRWYENINAVDPTTPYGGAEQKEAITGVPCGEDLRIRMNISVAIEDMAADSKAFKLQYGQGTDCTTISEENWHNVGAKGSGTIWRGYENAISDPQTITTLKLVDPGGSEAKESYSEENPSPKNPNAISSGQEGEWDWVVQENGATANTTYCFRMIYSNDDPLDGYNTDSYPKLTTGEPYVKQLHYRWRDNDGGE